MRLQSLTTSFVLALVLSGCWVPDDPLGPPVPFQFLRSTPAEGKTGVLRDENLSAQFNLDLDQASLNVSLVPEAPYKLTVAGNGIYLDPNGGLWAPNTEYTLTVDAASLVGERLPDPVSIHFTTGREPRTDAESPARVDFTPGNGREQVNPDATLILEFSRDMDTASVEGAISVEPPVSCDWKWGTSEPKQYFSCAPAGGLSLETTYTVRLAHTARRENGVEMDEDLVSTFTTAGPPTLVSTTPANEAVGVGRFNDILLQFSRHMDCNSVISAFHATSERGPVSGSWGCAYFSEPVYTLNPTDDFVHGDVIQWELAATATDTLGHPLAAPVRGSFRVLRTSTITLPAIPSGVGTVSANGTVSTGEPVVRVGRREGDGDQVAILTFDLTPIPDDAKGVVSATVNTTQGAAVGDPFGKRGTVVMDFVIADALDASDFSTPTRTYRTCNILFQCKDVPNTSLLSQSAGPGLRTAPAALAVEQSFHATDVQFRLRFSGAVGTSGSDYVEFASASAPSGAPTLELTYEHP